jgi:membrane-associated protein
MADAITDLVEGAMGSPWVYLALCAFAAIDAFFPVVPSESLVITAGVFAATGEPNVFAVIGVSALGAFAGDHVSYMIGRSAGGRLLSRAKPGSRRLRRSTAAAGCWPTAAGRSSSSAATYRARARRSR